MQTITLKRITIIAERLLKEQLLRVLRESGATGYTLINVEGEGSRGVRASQWEGQNLKIEAIVSARVADAIIEQIAARYFEHYAVIVYSQDVDVVRGDKYV